MNIFSVIKEARTLAQAKGLAVVFERECVCPRTDGKTIFLPTPKSDWDEKEEILWRHSTLHEIGHNDPRARDCFTFARDNNIDMQSFMGVCLNLIDDNRNEKIDINVLQGKRVIMDKGNKYARENLLEKGFYNPSEDKKWRVIQTMSAWDTRERVSWLPSLARLAKDMHDSLDAEEQGWLEKLKPYDARLGALQYATEEWELIKDVLKNVFDWTDEEIANEEQKATQSSGKGKSGEGSDGEGEGEASTDKGDGDGKSGEDAGGKVRYADILIHSHDEEKSGKGYPITIEYAEEDYHRGRGFNVSPTPKLVEYQKGQIAGMEFSPSMYRERVMRGFDTYSFAGKLKRLLQVKAQDLDVHGIKRGRFDRKNIYRATMTGTGGYSERIFKEKIVHNLLDRAVSVLVDCSGSMSGNKYTHAIRCAALINESLGKLNIPYEILGFTDGRTNATFPIFKGFDKRITTTQLIDYMADFGSSNLKNNPDGEALLFAEERLRRRKERGKLLIMISDGQPASSRGDAYSHTRDVIRQIEKEKAIDLIAIGLEDNSVQDMYKNYKVIETASELEAAMLSLLKDYII
jgi:Mg-chelatase subunit ChlD